MTARIDKSDPLAAAAGTEKLGSPAAQTGVWNRGALKNFVRRLGQSSVDSEDIVQEAYLRLLEGSGRGRSVGSQLGYLFVIARNLATDAGRKAARTSRSNRALQILSAQLQTNEPSPEELAFVDQARERLSRALRALPERPRQAFLLHRFRGLSHAEIAALFEVTVRTIERDTDLALKTLKEALSESAVPALRRATSQGESP